MLSFNFPKGFYFTTYYHRLADIRWQVLTMQDGNPPPEPEGLMSYIPFRYWTKRVQRGGSQKKRVECQLSAKLFAPKGVSTAAEGGSEHRENLP